MRAKMSPSEPQTKTSPAANGKTSMNGHAPSNSPWGRVAPLQPWIRVENVEEASQFYQRLGFHQKFALPEPDGTWAWAALRYGDCNLMVSGLDPAESLDPKREKHARKGPRGLGVRFYLTVPDIATVYNLCRGFALNFTSELRDEYWGDRCFSVVDPYGYEWTFAQHVRDLTPDEIVEAAGIH